VALDLGFFQLRWYSLAYLAGIIIGWWYLLKLLDRPARRWPAAMPTTWSSMRRSASSSGGRLGYVLFYRPAYYFQNPLEILQLWDGGMSFPRAGVIGRQPRHPVHGAQSTASTGCAIHDYVACCVPFGLFFGRIANFVNGELWGRGPTDVPWAVVFPTGGEVARHPSQLYEAGLEGLLLGIILWYLFWKTDARYQPGRLVGTFILGYGLSRFFVEFFRQPDEHLTWLAMQSGLSMGQWLCTPMILGGIFLVATSKGRRQRVEPIAGHESVA
jgi:phosphatidylglycerol:prolipoprotein diacylglycerol transferase